MKEILTLNSISPVVNDIFPSDYSISAKCENPIGIMLRSFKMHDYELPETVLAVARAGAGTNNIPCDKYAKKGVVVFNSPGANANAVKELVLCAVLLGARKIISGIEWAKSLKGNGENVAPMVEKGKSSFAGSEIYGKKLGIIGLGAIGAKVANAALGLGLDVYGYDPFMSVENALAVSRHIHRVTELETLIKTCDFITIHIPLLADNKGMFNRELISKMKNGAVIINCARGELVDNASIIEATKSGKIARYITDFPNDELLGQDGIICIPHLGASTAEAEDNCAVMAAEELIDFIENGNITNSVNMPNCYAPNNFNTRISVVHHNTTNMISLVSGVFGKLGVNIESLINKTKNDVAYMLIDSNTFDENLVDELKKIDGVINVRHVY